MRHLPQLLRLPTGRFQFYQISLLPNRFHAAYSDKKKDACAAREWPFDCRDLINFGLLRLVLRLKLCLEIFVYSEELLSSSVSLELVARQQR